jgi:hypothetical protein
VLAGHAAVETYSVLTRLPGDLRLDPADAARLLAERFAPPLLLAQKATRRLTDTFARLGISGGAVYDALVAVAAAEHDADLATRDARARATYEASASGSSSRPDPGLASRRHGRPAGIDEAAGRAVSPRVRTWASANAGLAP